MVINTSCDKIKKLIKDKKSFIVCTYYIDSFSSLYISKLNKELKKDFINIYYLEVEEFMKLFNLSKRIFPIFIMIDKGVLIHKTCGFKNYHELFNNFEKNIA